jgi:hypothetical protein
MKLAINCRYRPKGSRYKFASAKSTEGLNVPFPLIEIVKRERETQAARVLAGLAVMSGRKKQRSLAFNESQYSFDGNIECTQTLVNCTQCDHLLFVERQIASCFKLESLILAQNERWRQA